MHIRKYGTNEHTLDRQLESGGIHPFYEILYILDGEVELQWMGQTLQSSSPCLFLLTPNTPHHLNKVSANYRYWYIEIDIPDPASFPALEEASLWNHSQNSMNWQAELPVMIQRTLHSIECTLESLNGLNKKIAKELIALDMTKLFLLIKSFAADHCTHSPGVLPAAYDALGAKEALVHSTMRWLESNYMSMITLQQLADYVHLNPSYLDRIFKEINGTTPFQYLKELRLHAAKNYLETTTMTVQAISEAVGLQSIYYFSKLFKENFGKSPTQWRKEHT
ncbi:AraC family transcriptional regulator [Paenibacillus eucommiae]|uniref:AraC-like DNA-binding protein n=1 Tax=Paenibacillus eucommiae TaxID=1355755 RepID=A0ABS4IXC4_9BACL|nr:AraC family transcriptional regulator [Paenibacillus eucommiae]MBP1992208.1 AraC-like DNA-binding protein [Paenibacillus eucommiae]